MSSKSWMAIGVILLTLSAVACSKREAVESGAGMPLASPKPISPPRNHLAYEDEVEILITAERMQASLDAARQACTASRFGPCSVLEINQRGGRRPSARLAVRMAPQAVEPFIAAAAGTGEVGRRDTSAEDLADVVEDLEQMRDRAERERARLERFQERADLKVQDMVALSAQLAQVESQLQQVARNAAQNQRRIETHKVTVNWVTAADSGEGGKIREAFGDFGDSVASSLALIIRAVAFLLPVIIVIGLPLYFVMQRWKRRHGLRGDVAGRG